MKRFCCLSLLACLLHGSLWSQITVSGAFNTTDKQIPYPIDVILKNQNLQIRADSLGNYQFTNVPPGENTLLFKHLGFVIDQQRFTASSKNLIINYSEAFRKEPSDSSLNEVVLQEISIVSATSATSRTPIAFTNMSQEQIAKMNTGQDIPYLIRQTPSLVVTSDAGTGVGYTGLWIRGSDPARINVTINDIPLNDPESQQVFWVNTPDLASSATNLQIQRGVGSSTNGAGAFGGAIKINTLGIVQKAYAQTEHSFGSFNTRRNNISFGSGLIQNRFSLEGRLSNIQSDGYIDRASARLKSYYLDAKYQINKTSLQFTTFSGNEITYQSWYGTPAEVLEGGDRIAFADRNGLSDAQRSNLLNSGRSYNFYTYDNQVDNYTQSHYQAHVKHAFSNKLHFQLSGHYTRGLGYFEEYREQDDLANYGLPNSLFGSDSITNSDIVRRRWLDNHFYGGIASVKYQTTKAKITASAAWNQYDGDHFGEIIWAQFAPSAFTGDNYYEGTSKKQDANAFVNSEFTLGAFDVFADVQVRSVRYTTLGTDNDLRAYDVVDNLLFVNPKAGLAYRMKKNRLYASVAMANKEPNRNDYIDALAGVTPQSESLIDYEAGWQGSFGPLQCGVNFYYMDYTNQLVLTGEVNDVGAPIRVNVKDSFRRGVETTLNYRPFETLTISTNLTFSQNQIAAFTESIADYSNDGFAIVQIDHANTAIAFSPSVIGNATIDYTVWRDRLNNNARSFQISLLHRNVGKQYLDNTQNEEVILPSYHVQDLRLTYSSEMANKPNWSISFWVNNILDKDYSSNGYTFSYIFDDRITERFFYPQAGRNFMMTATIRI
jgi:iron complex outermembrane receptor protein